MGSRQVIRFDALAKGSRDAVRAFLYEHRQEAKAVLSRRTPKAPSADSVRHVRGAAASLPLNASDSLPINHEPIARPTTATVSWHTRPCPTPNFLYG